MLLPHQQFRRKTVERKESAAILVSSFLSQIRRELIDSCRMFFKRVIGILRFSRINQSWIFKSSRTNQSIEPGRHSVIVFVFCIFNFWTLNPKYDFTVQTNVRVVRRPNFKLLESTLPSMTLRLWSAWQKTSKITIIGPAVTRRELLLRINVLSNNLSIFLVLIVCLSLYQQQKVVCIIIC